MFKPMKPYSFLILLAALIVFSCKNESHESTATTLADSVGAADNPQHSHELVDSVIFHIGKHEFEISKSNVIDFNAVPDPFQIKDTSELNRIQKNAPAVSRNGDSLVFMCVNHQTVYLINNKDGDDIDNYSVYTFIQDMPQINQWLIMAYYYEAFGYVLIDKASGDSTMLYGMPVVSPDNKYMITFNQDMEAGFTFNGFQLFEIKNFKPVQLGDKELYTWGPDNVKWKDAHTLLVQQSLTKDDFTTSERSIETEYVQIKMK
jgi:hypothetical protein